MNTQATVPCRICDATTHMLRTELCNQCWALESRIRRDPELARKILLAIDTKTTKNKVEGHGTG